MSSKIPVDAEHLASALESQHSRIIARILPRLGFRRSWRQEGVNMRIRELEIKNFGKFADKNIKAADGIHLFYGENESGKSTVSMIL